MLRSIHKKKLAPEGYVYATYGHPKYLKHAIASVVSLRRYDQERPVALVCAEKHKQILEEHGLTDIFDVIHILESDRASIVGFKHNIHEYLFFEKNLFLDSDMIWCKNPDPLWQSFKPYTFTVTGTQVSDNFFGGPKNIGVIKDILLRRRKRTLKHFGLTYLSRVQTGMIYAQDFGMTKKVCELAQKMLDRKNETHFRSRTLEQGRSEESCEWSIAMAMSKLNLPIFPWLQGHTSPQLDYIEDYTSHDPDFEYVVCTYYCDQFVYNLRGIQSKWLRSLLTKMVSLIPGKGDYLKATPYLLHFGWYHQKQPFFEFAEKTWHLLTSGKKEMIQTESKLIHGTNQ
ncbi:glycosyltransferase family 2 protein [Aliifodinibius sp. S!AR15-10]|uniref:glycosyltransferase family A protein n=1 Tax=Aliifodinibius sp. S!AR15-10 TaxID=2950437 RepID=UPI002862C9E4|nr:glycosyltransferase family A protein [Aliifodinibius sp. S!AR15-10]MDR8391133.1 glycosyltransferase family 2 protein [Aliifodinibius sp. S!AR15-10]